MNAANDSPNYLRSNNRYVSSNKQVPSPQGAWRHWIIIRRRGRADTCIFADLALRVPSHRPFQVCRGGVPLCLHPHLGEGSFAAHGGSCNWVYYSQSSTPRNVGQLRSSFTGLFGRVVVLLVSHSLEAGSYSSLSSTP